MAQIASFPTAATAHGDKPATPWQDHGELLVHDPDYDAKRDIILSHRGITVLRFPNDKVEHQLGRVLYEIRQYLKTKT